jgi:hypothetical protein
MEQDSPSEEITGLPRYGCRRTGIIARGEGGLYGIDGRVNISNYDQLDE